MTILRKIGSRNAVMIIVSNNSPPWGYDPRLNLISEGMAKMVN
ncbi:MAG TPA: hypothetical protein VFT71_06475 [Candidatus Nitrosocosmicus sp.]|nr:hypothetical protein [Candidatus Nitrosocosmicus sp.]